MHLQAALPSSLNKFLVELFCSLGFRRSDKARTPALAAIAPKRELTYHEQPASNVDQLTIHLAFAVFEDS